MTFRNSFVLSGLLALVTACTETPAAEPAAGASGNDPGLAFAVRDTILPGVIEAPARVEPLLDATLSTKLMGQVVEVPVHAGDQVRAGTVLVRLDARDLSARREQANAGLRSAEAALDEARLQANRLRALHADSAAPRAQLDAAEAGLVRADQAVRAARAGAMEVESLSDYAVVRAPFGGTVIERLVDPGAFAAPGSPLVRIEDASRLRLVASVEPVLASRLRRGATIEVSIEGVPTSGRVEAVVPDRSASLVAIHVMVANPDRAFSSGSAATVSVPSGPRKAVLIPVTALVHRGDLTGVRVRSGPGGSVMRWVRVGRIHGGLAEVLSGLSAGDSIVVPAGA